MTENEREKYQGWTNYETWTVSLWLNNEEASYRYWRNAARRHRRDALQCERVIDGTWTEVEAAKFNLADQLKEEITDAGPLQNASVYGDLLDAALKEVDWQEIAQSLLDEVSEDEPPRATPPKIVLAASGDQPPPFSLGSVYSTPAALKALSPLDIASALARHAQGDWGDVCDEDRQSNEEALREGFRLFSVYHAAAGTKFWIITEADRSATTVLLPDDY